MIRAILNPTTAQRALIRRSCLRGGNDDPDDVIEAVENGHLLALATDESILLLADYGDSLHIAHYGGRLRDIPTLNKHASIVAQEMRKQYVTLNGRKGWRRYMKRFGFVPDGDNMRREIWAT